VSLDVVADIKDPQRSMNLGNAVLREWIEFCMAPAVLNPINSGIDNALFENLAGSILPYHPGGKPDWWAPPPPPNALFQHGREQEETIKNVSTYSDIVRGAPAPQNLSGRAMGMIEQNERGVHEPDETLLRLSIVDVQFKTLDVARNWYDDGRLMALMGSNKTWGIEELRREDIDWEVDLVIEPYSAQPTSRALRFAEVTDLLAAGALTDNPAAVRARRLLEIDNADGSTFDAEYAEKHLPAIYNAVKIQSAITTTDAVCAMIRASRVRWAITMKKAIPAPVPISRSSLSTPNQRSKVR